MLVFYLKILILCSRINAQFLKLFNLKQLSIFADNKRTGLSQVVLNKKPGYTNSTTSVCQSAWEQTRRQSPLLWSPL